VYGVSCGVRFLIVRRGDGLVSSFSSAGSFSGFKASWSRSATQDGIKTLCFFVEEEVGFKRYAPIAGGEENREELTRTGL